jgi:DNA segregation ATPase FtsK/SpoIIIE-like protein
MAVLLGAVLALAVDTVEDLVHAGMKYLPAKLLFRYIGEWKANGLPARFTVAVPTSVTEENEDTERLRLAEAEKRREQEAASALEEERRLAEEWLRQIEAERLRVEEEQKRVQEEAAAARSLAEEILREMEAESQRQREAEKRRQEERRLEEERQRQRRQEEEQARVREACARGHQRAGFFNPQDPGYTGYCGRPGCNYQFPRKVHRGGGTWY